MPRATLTRRAGPRGQLDDPCGAVDVELLVPLAWLAPLGERAGVDDHVDTVGQFVPHRVGQPEPRSHEVAGDQLVDLGHDGVRVREADHVVVGELLGDHHATDHPGCPGQQHSRHPAPASSTVASGSKRPASCSCRQRWRWILPLGVFGRLFLPRNTHSSSATAALAIASAAASSASGR